MTKVVHPTQQALIPVPSGHTVETITNDSYYWTKDGLHIYPTSDSDGWYTASYTTYETITLYPGQSCNGTTYTGTAPVKASCRVTRSYTANKVQIKTIKFVYDDTVIAVSGNNSYTQDVSSSQLSSIAVTSSQAPYILKSTTCRQAGTQGSAGGVIMTNCGSSYQLGCSTVFVGGTIGYTTQCRTTSSLPTALSLGNKLNYPDAVLVDFEFNGGLYKDFVALRQFHF